MYADLVLENGFELEQNTDLFTLLDYLLVQSASDIDNWSNIGSTLSNLILLVDKNIQNMLNDEPGSKESIHGALSKLYSLDFEIPTDGESTAHASSTLKLVKSKLENGVVQHLKGTIDTIQIENIANISGKEFIQKLLEITHKHRAFDHPYYSQTIRNTATKDDLKFYFAQEITVDPRFDDLVSMLQVGVKGKAKMELADNYWDEMGNGNLEDVHTDLFKKATDALGLDEQQINDSLSFESTICGNLSVMLAARRENFYRGAGYFGVMEYLVPTRMIHVLHAWKRNKLPESAIRYHEIHVSVDCKHAEGWFKNVIEAAVDKNPACAVEILEGALWRLESSAWYLDMLERHAKTER